MVKKKVKLKKRVIKKSIGLFFFLLAGVIADMAILNIKRLDILPDKYFYLIVGAEIIFGVIVGLLIFATKKKLGYIIGIILSIIMIVGNIVVGNYASKTNNFINKSFKEYMTITTDYVLVTSSRNPVNSAEELSENQEVYYYKYSRKN